MSKICELIINNYADREKLIIALINSGYTVSVEKRDNKEKPYGYGCEQDYIVIVSN